MKLTVVMPILEQVCKRLFSDSSWFIKCIVGALLLVVPGLHFFAFGYLYELVDRGRRGEPPELPEWEDWKRLFFNGVAAFVIFLVLALVPLALAWVLTNPLRLLPYGVLVYLPMVPVGILAVPLTVAGIYQYQRREEYADAFRPWVLLAMLRSTKGYLWVPTLALVGFMVAGSPLMTFTVFVGFVASWTFYAMFFSHVERGLRAGAPRV